MRFMMYDFDNYRKQDHRLTVEVPVPSPSPRQERARQSERPMQTNRNKARATKAARRRPSCKGRWRQAASPARCGMAAAPPVLDGIAVPMLTMDRGKPREREPWQ